jgi:hypothetical protein
MCGSLSTSRSGCGGYSARDEPARPRSWPAAPSARYGLAELLGAAPGTWPWSTLLTTAGLGWVLAAAVFPRG